MIRLLFYEVKPNPRILGSSRISGGWDFKMSLKVNCWVISVKSFAVSHRISPYLTAYSTFILCLDIPLFHRKRRTTSFVLGLYQHRTNLASKSGFFFRCHFFERLCASWKGNSTNFIIFSSSIICIFYVFKYYKSINAEQLVS